MTWFQAIITAVVEGLTEFLPISSTAHMKFAQAFMHVDPKDPFINMFDIVIQFAAILAVIVLYWKKFVNVKHISFYIKLLVAVIPSLIFGALLKKHIEHVLGSITIIATITVLGGIVLLFIDNFFKNQTITEEPQINNGRALKIGFFQILAIVFPGLSRSAATIIGGMASGLTRSLAAEFSFFLAVPTMAAATAKELLDTYKETPEVFHSSNNGMLVAGCLIAFIVSVVSIKFFITYLQKHGFKVFGVYRIIAGLIILGLALTNVI
ncbi:undecaprenyl-diphosphate phosphatase [Taibaiella soli]|uniref:Undecaprenyl-diphosphatase n=1 Tax=Taibaiella soli TaxID=1649169 RepID=A0A2W2B0W0_9BACT|nr:undecaprenyl-diphosphate phosphatase [Taibaiella soli]PZF73874.1 UDP-diphosphatase [Taibaiella soli]